MAAITLTTLDWRVVVLGGNNQSTMQTVHHYQERCYIPTLRQLMAQDLWHIQWQRDGEYRNNSTCPSLRLLRVKSY